jgi:hypothetical protein
MWNMDYFYYTSTPWGHVNCHERAKRYLETIPVKHSADALLKTAVLEKSRVIREVLQSEI